MLIFYASDIVDIEKPDGICSRRFVVDEFSCIHQSFLLYT